MPSAPAPKPFLPFDAPISPRPEEAREAGRRMPRSPQQLRADETTRVARELIDAQTEKRHAATARLRAARVEKEADAAAIVAAAPKPAPKSARKTAPKTAPKPAPAKRKR